MSREIFVSIDLSGTPHDVGRLWIHERQGIERCSFKYAGNWLSTPGCFPIEPSLPLGEGTYHVNRPLFGAMDDTAPDRWGRMLMERMEAKNAAREGRTAVKLGESDYLLMVDDKARQGALRFATAPEGPFLACRPDVSIPPLVEIGNLLDRSTRVINEEEGEQDLLDILAPGSSLGGARPKASVVDREGSLWIAKFPSPKDEWDVELWEYLALKMAKKCHIAVPEFMLKDVSGKKVLLVKRFDRKGPIRIPFLSAMTMLEAQDREPRSYLEIAEAIVIYGTRPKADLQELWRRMVYNILISNLDDHLRNHGFLYDPKLSGWCLSPVYDLEPLPEQVKSRYLQTSIDLENNLASLNLAFEVAGDFGLTLKDARGISLEMGKISRTWGKEAVSLGAGKREIDFMASAFEHGNLRLALKRSGSNLKT
ncbi:MAG TPA: type II toxin-antitoxin system HipA family toxin [Desulfobacteraceae bacterium]|nr:type II toxin-antitoxin system HipA family toxin [Desulfobacteraceae bacterium]